MVIEVINIITGATQGDQFISPGVTAFFSVKEIMETFHLCKVQAADNAEAWSQRIVTR